MARPRNSLPTYSAHPQTGRARAIWTDQTGVRHFRTLPGAFNSPESRAAFATLLLEQEAFPHQKQFARPESIKLAELLLAFLNFAERHYRGADGKPTSELRECKQVIRSLRELFAEKPAIEFGPICLKTTRQAWANAGLARSECNRRTNLVRRIFKWAASEELVDAKVYQGLTVVTGLQRGRTAARESIPIKPVDDSVVDATLPFLSRHVRGLIAFQRMTGCRPGEACVVRQCDIDKSGVIWVFKPILHKSAWRAMTRTIAIGPKTQEVLNEFFVQDVNAYLFSGSSGRSALLS
jgi:integrase